MELATLESHTKLDELLRVLSSSRSLLVLTHDNPDPDGLSAASCLRYVVSKKLGVKTRVGYGGVVGRAENQAMLRLLKIHTIKLSESTIRRYKSVILIDTQPMTGNNSLPGDVKAVGVVDHHPQRRSTRAPFLDIRPNYGASATILAEYLFASGLDIPTNLATALFYGIASETQDLGREVSEADKKAYLALSPKTNWRLLSKIRRPGLEKAHFTYLARAISNAVTYKHAAATSLGRVDYADIVAEVAEMLIMLKRITWCLCTGRFNDTILISVRTSRVKGRAGKIARRVVGSGGTAGGHDMIAGGQVDCTGKSESERDLMERKYIEIFFRLMGKQDVGEISTLFPSDVGERTIDEVEKKNGARQTDTPKREEVKQ
jgi:nanoRNase/pAp phosphatase (c-di-AMP/oligoRNAs hydrolase)